MTSPLDASNLAGQVIDAGRLRLDIVLGEGAYGVVYRAVEQRSITSWSLKPAARYAVKVLIKADGATTEGRCQSREIVAHKIVSDHPNVLTLHKILEDDQFIYLVLDYCPGGDLYSAIVERRSFSRNDALIKSVFVQILDAVQSCHDKGIYHRDLKPDNVFVSDHDTKAFLGDFGLCTDVEHSASFSCGSSYYMSPECIGEDTKFMPYSTPTSDVWALGVILVNMVVGRNPWDKATTMDRQFNLYLTDKSVLRKFYPMSHAVANILDKIFTFNPSDRITIPQLREEIMSVRTFFPTNGKFVASPRPPAVVGSPHTPPAVFPKVVVKDMDLGACHIRVQDNAGDVRSPDPNGGLRIVCPGLSPLSAATTLISSVDGRSCAEEGRGGVIPAKTLVTDTADVACLKHVSDGQEPASAFSFRKAIASLVA